MTRPRNLSRTEMAKRIDAAWHQILEENGLVFNPTELKAMIKTAHLSPQANLARGLTIGAAIGLSSAGKKVAPMIRSEEQFYRVLQEMKRAGDKIPTMLRKATKDMARALPRKGGPGRQPKLSPREASLMCDQIALFIRQKNTLRQALQKTSELSPRILEGKTVSPRTLQKAWDIRDKFTRE